MSNSTYGLKWHKFLVFCIGLGAVLDLVLGGITLLSAFAAETQNLMLVLLISTVFCIVSAVFSFVVHGRLKGLCANGPKLLVAMYILQLVVTIADSIIPVVLAPELYTFDSSSIVGSITGTIIAIAINSSYYKKREDIFVN